MLWQSGVIVLSTVQEWTQWGETYCFISIFHFLQAVSQFSRFALLLWEYPLWRRKLYSTIWLVRGTANYTASPGFCLPSLFVIQSNASEVNVLSTLTKLPMGIEGTYLWTKLFSYLPHLYITQLQTFSMLFWNCSSICNFSPWSYKRKKQNDVTNWWQAPVLRVE